MSWCVTHILCPIDLSDISGHVVDHASALARWYGARLTLLHVVVDRPALGIPASPLDQAEIDQLVEAMRRASAGVPALVHVDFVVRHAPAADTVILNEAVQRQADLLVIGTHGRSGFKRLVLGSVAEAVTRRSPCPTVVVPPRAADVPAATPVQFKQILCAVDFSECSLVAVTQAIELARQAAAHLTLLHVIEAPPELTADVLDPDFSVDHARAAAEAEALRRLRELRPRDPAAASAITTRAEEGLASGAILRTAAELHADLIVMGVRGRRAIDLLVFGSTTNHVLREARCPVLVMRTDEGPRA